MVNFSQSEENYLKTIYHLQEASGVVTTSVLAEELQSRPASITDMTKKLSAKKLLDYKPYYGFSLTAEGKKAALNIIRRHRLWEYFLAEKLGFAWNEIHVIAEELEHISSKKLVDRLDAFLGYPAFDPHGDPIPDSKGKIAGTTIYPLSQLPLNETVKVCRVMNQSNEVFDILKQKGITIGTIVEVKKKYSFDDSLQLKIHGKKTQTITKQLAANIFVEYESKA